MKGSIYILAIFLLLASIGSVFPDKASEAYRSALDSGNNNAAFTAQSYLAPSFAYDLNRLHGITFTKSVNGRVEYPRFPFTYQDMSHLKVRKLYERAGIAAMEKASRTELELIQHISDWANMQYGHMLPMPYPAWDAHEILDRAEQGDSFFCTYKAVLFIQACNAAGLTGRIFGINRQHQDAHTVSEVYSNEYRKWMLVDPWMNCYYERDGIPLSAREMHDSINSYEGISIVFGENGKGLEYWEKRTQKADSIPHANKRVLLADDDRKGLIEYYFDIRAIMRNDHMVHPQSKENLLIDDFMIPYNPRGGEWWGPQLKWTDDTTPPLITSDNTGDVDDFEWPLNEVEVTLKRLSLPGESIVLEARFETFTPNFARYDLEIDGANVSIDSDVYIWRLHEGGNSLTITSVNDTGRSGFPSEFALDYDPSAADFSRLIDVVLPNPDAEYVNPKSPDKTPLPDMWGTICSNRYNCKEFRLDSRTKHSGKYSIRATPAKDPETGVEYSFFVKTDIFDVNPATDVTFTIWLKASAEDTPVDIYLHDESKWGLGIFSKQVLVGKKWKQYELKCRLHNEMIKAFVGIKVYTGTVWADDIGYTEVK
ncbi:transglutaminase domain-containing protein [Candidatus Latescibacterota bacterium]